MEGDKDISVEISNLMLLLENKYTIESAAVVKRNTYIDLLQDELKTLQFNDFEDLNIHIYGKFSKKNISICISADLLEYLIDDQKLNSIVDFIDIKDIEQSLFN